MELAPDYVLHPDGNQYLADDEGNPRCFVTRFSALATIADRAHNYRDRAALHPHGEYYRIKLLADKG